MSPTFSFGPTLRGLVVTLVLLIGLFSTASAPASQIGRALVGVSIVAVSLVGMVLSVSRIVFLSNGIQVRPQGLLGKRRFIPYDDIVEARWLALGDHELQSAVEIVLRSGPIIRLGPWRFETPRFEVVRKRAIEACAAINAAKTGPP